MKKGKLILGLNPCINGMNYHDPSVALFRGNSLLCAIEEERLNRVKSSKGVFPIKSIEKCCEIAGVSIDDIDVFAVGYLPELLNQRKSLDFLKVMESSNLDYIITKLKKGGSISSSRLDEVSLNLINKLSDSINKNKKLSSNDYMRFQILKHLQKNVEVKFFEHHLVHAASAFYPSGFDNSLILVIDGVGEVDSLSLWRGEKGKIEKLESFSLPYSLGYFYAAFTAFLGFEPWGGEGKLMALSPYGQKDNKLDEKIKNLDIRKLVYSCLGESFDLDIDKAKDFIRNGIGVLPREKDNEIKKIYKDIAFSVQDFLEKEVISIIEEKAKKYEEENFCFAGGVFLNCKLNKSIRENSFVKKSFFQPVSKDSGLALGAGILASCFDSFDLKHLSLGQSFSSEYIAEILERFSIKYKKRENIFNYIADQISKGKIVFWFQGGSEFGPRALGSRSILADPRDEKLSKFLNDQIKHREDWRPFACSILEDYANEVLENYQRKSPFMIEAYFVKKDWTKKIKGVIHSADKTTRPQTVSKDILPKYYSLINEFKKITGIPLLLNTSLNDRGKPIINKPEEAIRFFYSSCADLLVMEDIIVEKS